MEKIETEKSEAQVPLTATEEKKEDMVMNYRLTKKSGLVLTLPNVISQYLFFFFSYIFLFVSLSTIYFYCRTTETTKGTNHRCSKM